MYTRSTILSVLVAFCTACGMPMPTTEADVAPGDAQTNEASRVEDSEVVLPDAGPADVAPDVTPEAFTDVTDVADVSPDAEDSSDSEVIVDSAVTDTVSETADTVLPEDGRSDTSNEERPDTFDPRCPLDWTYCGTTGMSGGCVPAGWFGSDPRNCGRTPALGCGTVCPGPAATCNGGHCSCAVNADCPLGQFCNLEHCR